MGGYAVVLAVAAGTTFLTTFVVRWLASRTGAVVAPDERRVHQRPTPTLGGLGMFLGFLASMGVASRLDQFAPLFDGSTAPLAVLVGGGVITGVGFLDDLRDVSPPAKMAGYVLAGSVLFLLGVTMLYFRLPFAGFIVLGPDIAPLVTALWVAAICTAVNWIDGLDGLAAGIVAIAGAALFLYGDRLFKSGLLEPDNVGPLIAIIAVGLCLGFLPHNFNPAKIFMGETGAALLGLLMAAATMVIGGQTADQFSGQTYFFFAPIFIPFFILGVPIIDTFFAIVRRTIRRRGAAVADREHLHHRLERMGHGHRRSVLILWAWTAILSGIVLFPTYTNQGNAVIPLGVAALGVALYTAFHPGVRQRAEFDPDAEREDPQLTLDV